MGGGDARWGETDGRAPRRGIRPRRAVPSARVSTHNMREGCAGGERPDATFRRCSWFGATEFASVRASSGLRRDDIGARDSRAMLPCQASPPTPLNRSESATAGLNVADSPQTSPKRRAWRLSARSALCLILRHNPCARHRTTAPPPSPRCPSARLFALRRRGALLALFWTATRTAALGVDVAWPEPTATASQQRADSPALS